MAIALKKAREYLQGFNFQELFIEELGWDYGTSQQISIAVDGEDYRLKQIAQKRGMVVYGCDRIPSYAIRAKIDREAVKYSREHFIIFADGKDQVWQWVRREQGKPIARREHRVYANQSGDALLQKLEAIAVSFADEEDLTIVDVAKRTRKAFDVDKVTKKFYENFKKQHEQFLKVIEGFHSKFDQEWYASLMLNRLMFIYFMQKKGFLDRNINYLQDRLAICQHERGDNQFQTFYRYFLLRLFHDGLGKQTRTPELEKLLGKIPYLNGGLFEEHPLEKANSDIQIPDTAFKAIFDFFDGYNWHLDDRPLRSEKEINPDVLGYIFEKYINQKQMGAYYTKEDITEYISKNCIIPFLFEATKKECAIAFEPNGALWRLLRENPDRYIYDAVRKGVDLALPSDIADGISDVAKRTNWNKSASADHALPTETWREHVARRTRCLDLRQKLIDGEVSNINDLITYNLDIRQFAQDAIANCEGVNFLLAFYQAIERVSILDPTCGSGAFLFAALNILEPLYDACLERMQGFIDDCDRSDDPKAAQRHQEFRQFLDNAAKHPNRRYFILKSITINNLYGVDIMEEATEICKLRLFLKLVSQVEADAKKPNYGIEPLPDIDFNIRAGNTLVGFVSLNQVCEAIAKESSGQGKLIFDDGVLNRIVKGAVTADQEFKRFKSLQSGSEVDGAQLAWCKASVNEHLAILRDELDLFLAEEYEQGLSKKSAAFAKWRLSHQPFQWFVEFYGIVNNGGFDVIIGNPPYVEYKNVKKSYQVKGYSAESADNLYAFSMERATLLLNSNSYFGMIVPTSVIGLDDTESLRSVLLNSFANSFCSTYSIRPSKLFDGVDQRLCIYIGECGSLTSNVKATKYYHWKSEQRSSLFPCLYYEDSFNHLRLKRIPQTGSKEASNILAKLEDKNQAIVAHYFSDKSGHLMHYHRSPRYWIRAMDFEQYFKSPTRERSIHHFRDLYFAKEDGAKGIGAIINSSLFFFWFISVGNGRNITGIDVSQFPVGEFSGYILKDLSKSFDKLMTDYKQNSFVRTRQDCEFQEFRPSLSKPIIDEIDRVLAQHYGFSDEELDFIINYDIKYRMGRDTGEEE